MLLKSVLKVSFTLFDEECCRKFWLTTNLLLLLATDFLIQTPFPYRKKIYIYIYIPRGRTINFIFIKILQKQSLRE